MNFVTCVTFIAGERYSCNIKFSAVTKVILEKTLPLFPHIRSPQFFILHISVLVNIQNKASCSIIRLFYIRFQQQSSETQFTDGMSESLSVYHFFTFIILSKYCCRKFFLIQFFADLYVLEESLEPQNIFLQNVPLHLRKMCYVMHRTEPNSMRMFPAMAIISHVNFVADYWTRNSLGAVIAGAVIAIFLSFIILMYIGVSCSDGHFISS